MNIKKLIPITGALITGLIGVAVAECYGFTTGLCHYPDDTVKWNYLDCPGVNPPTTQHYEALHATGYWDTYTAFVISEPGHEDQEQATSANDYYCRGPASYIDCNGTPHTLSVYDDVPLGTYFRAMHDMGYPAPCEWP